MRAPRTMKATVGVLAALVATMMFATVASAQTDEYADVLTANVSNPTPGVSCNNRGIVVTVDRLDPGSAASFTLFSDPVDLGTVNADAEGVATLVFDLPAGTDLGIHRIVIEGTNEFKVADSTEVTLRVASCVGNNPGNNPGGNNNGGSGGRDLARTGTDLGGPLRIGMLVLAVGAALLVASRKRAAQA